MTTLPSLEILKKHQKELLLAEVAAWLHDWQKCIDMTVASMWCKNLHLKNTNKVKEWQQRGNVLKPRDFAQALSATTLSLENQSIDLKTLCQEGKDPSNAKNHNLPIVQLLGVCHGFAHVDKELDVNESKDQACDRISTAFGFEPVEPEKLFENLLSTVKPKLENLDLPATRAELSSAIQGVFSNAWGDTRRPINEVTLWDWGYLVASLYKSVIAGSLLQLDTSCWRIIRLNFDTLALYAKAIKIADLLAYQKKVEDACAAVKSLVEEEYPLGNEIYRDTTGIYFTFPDLDLPADLAQEIRRRVEQVEPELAPRIAVTTGDGAIAQEQLKSILGKARGDAKQELAYHPFDVHNLNPIWQQKWDEAQLQPGNWEKCPLCGLRPKLESSEVCEHCKKRRISRLETWLKTPAQTIWLGEIADHNDRVALLVGKFGLEDWLSGDLVQTMLVKADENNPAGCTPKNPSPARLRRVWETCQNFWQKTVLEEIIPQTLGEQERKHIVPNKTNWRDGLYNGKVNSKPIDLFWQPEHKAFLTVSSLQAAGELKPGDTITLKDPDRKTDAGSFKVQRVEDVSNAFAQYQPWLSLLASPDQFLAFIPASDVFAIVKEIRSEYTNQFGKVRNRLPLHLNVVYFERKMPLMAVMDSARQMLEQPVLSEQWTVSSMSAESKTVGGQNVETAKCLTLQRSDIKLTVRVPTVMGDGQTPDVWYPYWRVEGEPSGRARWFIGPDGEHWVHVNDLKEGDTVHLTPSTFDFLWLDAAARRFKVGYDKNGRRPARPTRPYSLEDLDRLEEVWGAFSKLSRTQLKQTLQTIESARERWFGRDQQQQSVTDNTFCQFVQDTLANAQWDWKQLAKEQKDHLITAAARGELTDWAELHLEILKEKTEEGANA